MVSRLLNFLTEESYADCHESVADFAEELTTDTSDITESLA